MMRLFTLFFFLLATAALTAQQLPSGSFFRENQFTSNPAMTAAYDFWEVNAGYRQQWVGFEGAPRTVAVNGQFPFKNMGIGGVVQFDKTGPTQMSRFGAAYSYKIPIGITDYDRLSFGLMATISEYQVNPDEIIADSYTDLFIPVEMSSTLTPNASAGIFYNSDGEDDFGNNSIFIGVGFNQLIRTEVPVFAETLKGRIERVVHANAIAGARFVNGDIALEPSLWMNYAQQNVTSFNLALRVEKQETFNAGLIYSSHQTLGLQFGYALKGGFWKDGVLRIGILGEYNLGTVGQYQGGGYQIVVGYRLRG